MSKQIIIECNQQDQENANVVANGDYHITLKKPVVLQTGDSVQMKSAFIDTVVANSDKITINGDQNPDGSFSSTQTIKFTFGYYKTDIENFMETVVDPTKRTIKNFQNEAAFSNDGPNLYTGREFPATTQVVAPNTASGAIDIQSIDFYLDYPVHYPPFSKGAWDSWRNILLYFEGIDGKQFSIKFYMNDGFASSQAGFEGLIKATDSGRRYMTFNNETIEKLNKISKTSKKVICSVNFSFPITIATPPGGPPYPYVSNNPASNATYLKSITSTNHPQSAGGIFKTYTDSVSIEIPASVYSPSGIAKLINEKLTELNLKGTKLEPSDYKTANNPFLKTIQQIKADEGINLHFWDPGANNRKFEIDTTGVVERVPLDITQPVTTFPRGNSELLNYYIGTSQFGLTYNEDVNKFEILTMHNSLFNDKINIVSQDFGKATSAFSGPEVRLIRNKAFDINSVTDDQLNNLTKFTVNKATGIFLMDVEPIDLFIGTDSAFKFGSDLIPKIETITKTIFVDVAGTPTSIDSTVIQPTGLADGVNITGDSLGLDEVIIKQPGADGAFVTPILATNLTSSDICRPLTQGREIVTTTTEQTSILAPTPIGVQAQNETGYYKISVSANGLNTDLRGYGENNNIQAVVSKFYSSNAFTSAYSEGSIPLVINTLEPVLINSFHIRVLEGDNTLSKELGNRNSVFLEVIKNPIVGKK